VQSGGGGDGGGGDGGRGDGGGRGGGVLRCTHCRGVGPASASSLELSRCKRDTAVDNIQGELQCHPEPNEAGIPAGGYQASCLGCSLSLGGALLTCSHCPTADGARYLSTYETARCPAPAQLDNNNGHLVCSGLRNAPNLPAGGYADSCQGCAVDEAGEQLFCSHCSAADGRQLFSSHRLDECAARTFDNRDGELVCAG
jgi:hypothetical protein